MTAISDVSGRGVGMDVVKTKIAQLNGSLSIASGSLHGWVWLVAAFIGNSVGVRLRPLFFEGERRQVALMWLLVGTRTVQGAYRGELFVSPCIAGLKK